MSSSSLTFGRNEITRTAVAPIHKNADMTADKARWLLGNRMMTKHTAPVSVRVSPDPSNKQRLSSRAGNVTWRICHLEIKSVAYEASKITGEWVRKNLIHPHLLLNFRVNAGIWMLDHKDVHRPPCSLTAFEIEERNIMYYLLSAPLHE